MSKITIIIKKLGLYGSIIIFAISLFPTMFFLFRFIYFISIIRSINYTITTSGDSQLADAQLCLTFFIPISLFFLLLSIALIFNQDSENTSSDNIETNVVCEHCDKLINKNSVFCQHCGNVHLPENIQKYEIEPDKEDEKRKIKILN